MKIKTQMTQSRKIETSYIWVCKRSNYFVKINVEGPQVYPDKNFRENVKNSAPIPDENSRENVKKSASFPDENSRENVKKSAPFPDENSRENVKKSASFPDENSRENVKKSRRKLAPFFPHENRLRFGVIETKFPLENFSWNRPKWLWKVYIYIQTNIPMKMFPIWRKTIKGKQNHK